jgi:hypothetical protein
MKQEDGRNATVDARCVGRFTVYFGEKLKSEYFPRSTYDSLVVHVHTFDQAPENVKTHNHSNNTPQSLLTTTNVVQGKTARNGDCKGPAVQDNIDLCLSLCICDTSLVQNLSQVKSGEKPVISCILFWVHDFNKCNI